MKIAKRDLKLLLVLAGLLVFLLAYMLVFNPLQTKIAEVEAENAQLSAEVQDLEAKYLRMGEYEEGIKNSREYVKETLKNFPGDVKEEDILSYLLTMESRQGIRMESVTFNKPELVQQFDMMAMQDGKDVAIPAGAYVIAMCIEGKELSSTQLAEKLRAVQNSGNSKICLIIGSSNGMDDSIKQRADFRLSMSPMTFPHHLARVMVLEQVYRGLSILAGSKYHK